MTGRPLLVGRAPGDGPPSRASLGALDALDAAGERLFGPLRGRRSLDTAAGATSNLADYGAVWVLLAALKGRRPGPRRARAWRALAMAGVASYGLNRALKATVGRERPAPGADPGTADDGHRPAGMPVRTPSSSSFPSGHTLAAFCAAVAIPETAGGVAAGTGFAAAVAASRVHLRAHHLSDVVAGAVLGSALGAAVRRLVGRPGRRTAPGPRRARPRTLLTRPE